MHYKNIKTFSFREHYFEQQFPQSCPFHDQIVSPKLSDFVGMFRPLPLPERFCLGLLTKLNPGIL